MGFARCLGRTAKQRGLSFGDGWTGRTVTNPVLMLTGREAVCASPRAHGTGKNLQQFARNLVANPPSDGATWEQLIGRTHRQGQEADEVTVEVYRHTAPFLEAVEKARDLPVHRGDMGSGAAARPRSRRGGLMTDETGCVRSSMATLSASFLDFAYVISMLSPVVPTTSPTKPTTTTNRQPQQGPDQNLQKPHAASPPTPRSARKSSTANGSLPARRGTAVITNIVQVEKDGTTNTFLEAKILESHATGKTPAQAPRHQGQEDVRPQFKKWWKEELMNDLLNIAGLEGTEGEPVNNYLSSALGTLCGIVGGGLQLRLLRPADAQQARRAVQGPIVNTRFSEAGEERQEAMVEAHFGDPRLGSTRLCPKTR